MITCRSCGMAFNGNFCTNCGTPAAPSAISYCPRCNQRVAPGTAFCASCGLALQPSPYQGQTPPYAPPIPPQPAPPQQSNVGKYVLGALGGAAAVIGGEMLLHDVERGVERHVERDVVRDEWRGEPHRHHHHHHHHHRRCMCGHEFGIDLEICPRCRRRWGSW
jgi:hypothetical protein